MRRRSIYKEYRDQSSRYEGSKDADFRTAIQQKGRERVGSDPSCCEERTEDCDDNTASQTNSQTEEKDRVSSRSIGR